MGRKRNVLKMVIEKIIKLLQNNSLRMAYKHNSRLFHEFYKDMDRNSLPHFHDPTKEEIDKYIEEKERKMMTMKTGTMSDNPESVKLISYICCKTHIFAASIRTLTSVSFLTHWVIQK